MTNNMPNIEKTEGAAVKPARSARSTRSTRPARSIEPGQQAKPMAQKKTTRRPAAKTKNTKTDQMLKLLRRAKDVSIADMAAATGWQAHSIRGFLSGTVKKRLGLVVISEKDKNDIRQYRVAHDGAA